VREPKAFLFDEPLSNLDAKLRVQTRADLIRLHQRLQTTTIYVTHDQVEAMTMGTRIAVLLDGVLQQLDTPQALYDRPVNTFVAGFIGSPAMNMLRMGVTVEGEEVRLQREGFAFAVPAPYRAVLRPYNGQEVILGIRPEDISLQGHGPRGDIALPARVDVIEPLGSETYLYTAVAGTSLVARVRAGADVRPDEQITLYAAADKLHLFDAVSEVNLLYAAARQPASVA
jgi:multiple sugar transport system ATP-binding protein